MGGKALLILVVAFSIVYLLMGRNFNDITTNAVVNSVDYYNETTAHNIAVSGANMAANQLFLNSAWAAGYDSLSYQKGKLNVDIEVDTLPGSKIPITIITSKGIYRDKESNVTVKLRPSNFSKFAYYSEDENNVLWASGDTVYGPLHTQDDMEFSGNAWFKGKVTLLKKLILNGKKPKFIGGVENGVNLPLPPNSVTTIEPKADENGKKFTGNDTVYITFDYDSIKYRYSWNSAFTAVLASSFAPNGVIFAKEATIRLQGNVRGRYSVIASEYESGSTTKGGNIYLDGDIKYESNPLDGYSVDMLGIVAENYVYITNNSTNNQNDIDIHAAIFCLEDGFKAESHDSRGYEGYIKLLGGITQKTRGAVGKSSGGVIYTGFSKRYIYDERFMIDSPPCFPNTNSFEIISWLE